MSRSESTYREPAGDQPQAGYQAGKRSGRIAAGTLAAVVAGTIAGGAGGLSYVFFGKPVLNVAVGLVLGSLPAPLSGLPPRGWTVRVGPTSEECDLRRFALAASNTGL